MLVYGVTFSLLSNLNEYIKQDFMDLVFIFVRYRIFQQKKIKFRLTTFLKFFKFNNRVSSPFPVHHTVRVYSTDLLGRILWTQTGKIALFWYFFKWSPDILTKPRVNRTKTSLINLLSFSNSKQAQELFYFFFQTCHHH